MSDAEQGSPDPERRYRLEDPRVVRALIAFGVLILVALVVVDLFVPHKGHFTRDGITIDTLPEFFPLYGFGASLVFVLVAKALGLLLKRKDSYYRGEDLPGPEERP